MSGCDVTSNFGCALQMSFLFHPSIFILDEVHTLTCALLLLNTDLHGQNIRKKMSTREFIDNLSNTGFNYKRDLLKCLHSAIKNAPIEWARDTPEFDVDRDVRSNGPIITSTATSAGSKGVPLLQVPDPDSQVEYKNGWVMRKCVYDSDGKRTPLGRRGWKMFYATLKGMVLYLHKDERGFKNGHYQTFNNAILIHHSIAQRPNDYSKKQHVFRLRTANLGEFLFQTRWERVY
uniref:Uncharacterized protein n=1 Tax=Plectus sambesii TaxID=2011161 RepID=A0A914UQQ4_9BILA